MTQDDFIALLNHYGYSYTAADGVITIDHRGYVYLHRLTALPEGVVFNNGGSVELHDLTALPKGVTFNNGGNVHLHNLTALPEGIVFNNSGYVHLSSLTEERQPYRGGFIRLRYVDYYTMLVRSERVIDGVTVSRAAYFGGGDLDKLKPCYVASADGFNAHGDTIEQAMLDLRFKIAQRDYDPVGLAREIRQRGTVHINDFRLITGACESGTRHGMEQAGLDPNADELPLTTVLNTAFGNYGERFKSFFS